jgi:hypothetical protein
MPLAMTLLLLVPCSSSADMPSGVKLLQARRAQRTLPPAASTTAASAASGTNQGNQDTGAPQASSRDTLRAKLLRAALDTAKLCSWAMIELRDPEAVCGLHACLVQTFSYLFKPAAQEKAAAENDKHVHGGSAGMPTISATKAAASSKNSGTTAHALLSRIGLVMQSVGSVVLQFC